ncbi:hypothetical protein KKE60_06080 [Patescibacteria group bacterium]|nr:hypothetical protein [Patescibacteria group bacterium]
MGSGYFPLEKRSNTARELEGAIATIDRVREEHRDDIYGGFDGQYDNAARDGGYLERLWIAKDLLVGCIRKT